MKLSEADSSAYLSICGLGLKLGRLAEFENLARPANCNDGASRRERLVYKR
jgi:hypothetical protein